MIEERIGYQGIGAGGIVRELDGKVKYDRRGVVEWLNPEEWQRLAEERVEYSAEIKSLRATIARKDEQIAALAAKVTELMLDLT